MRVDTKAELGEIFGFDFTDFIITELFYETSNGEATRIYLFGIGNEEAISLTSFSERRFEDMSPGMISRLYEAGIPEGGVSSFWVQIKGISLGFWTSSYQIWAFPLVEYREDGSNIFMYTALDARVVIDVERILAEPQS